MVTVLQKDTYLWEADAARAEAFHVDGCYQWAAEEWEKLAGHGYLLAESSLKTGVALLSLGDVKGLRWLDRAGKLEDSGSADYVRAQFCSVQGSVAEAIKILQLLQSKKDISSTAVNTLGVLYWQLGWVKAAREQFLKAIELDPDNGEALANLGSIDFSRGQAPPRHLLERAALTRPHRYEPHVLYSRCLRRMGKNVEAQRALIKARLRQNNFALPRRLGVVEAAPTSNQARVSVVFDHARVTINVVFHLASTISLPDLVAINEGYEEILIGDDKPDAIAGADVDRAAFSLSQRTRVLRLTPNCWQRDADGFRLEISAKGSPLPPCVGFREGEVELGSPSAWVPLLLPPVPVRWEVDVQSTSPFQTVISDDAPSGGMDLICLNAAAKVSRGLMQDGVECIGNVEPLKRELAGIVVSRAAELWKEVVGPQTERLPAIVVVSRPDSTFCYTRKAFIRVASGVLNNLSSTSLLCHEVGHLWWGVDVRICREDDWLLESLAEYTLHLAEDAGLVPDYRAAVINGLNENRELSRKGLKDLSGRTGAAAAAVLRQKGGFMLRMLSQVMGASGFERLLRSAYSVGKSRSLDAYTFCSLASRIHGHSLNWFFNQWVYSDADLCFSVGKPLVERQSSGFLLTFELLNEGIATPGVSVPIRIEQADAGAKYIQSNLELGVCQIVTPLTAAATRIVVDPECEWYAVRQDFEFAPEE